MENGKHVLTFLLILGAGARISPAQAAFADAVVAWRANDFSQLAVPLAAQSGVKAIAAGGDHTVVLKNDGTLVAWGWNVYGQVTGTPNQDAPYTDIANPVTFGGQVLLHVTAVAAGATVTVALKNDGSVIVWGDNSSGQTNVPAGLSGVTAITAGGDHILALKSDGSVVSWGSSSVAKMTVPASAQSGVRAISAGDGFSVALKNDGSVIAWGDNFAGQITRLTSGLAALTGVRAIAAGADHVVALRSDGAVQTWVTGGNGKATVPLTAQSGVKAIAAAGIQTAALKTDGSVIVWRRTYDNSGSFPDVPAGHVPGTVPVGLTGVTAIAAGPDHIVALVVPVAPSITQQPASQAADRWQRATFAITTTGYPLTYQWRKDGVDVPGANSATYILPFAQSLQAGNYSVVVHNTLGSVTSSPPARLTVNPASPGAVVAWGDNSFGQTTVPVAAQSGVTAIAAGHGHTVALKSDGTVIAWGLNAAGQVTGTPSPDQAYAVADPVTLGGQVLRGVTAIAAGSGSTWAVKTDGTVVAWGWLGISSPDGPEIANPVTLGGHVLSGVIAISAGSDSTFALKSDRSVEVFSPWDQTTVPVSALNEVTAIAGEWYGSDMPGIHHAALKSNGTVVAWGSNELGQVTGESSAQAVANPVTLGDQVLEGVIAIAAAADSTFALKNNGTVVQWGLTWAVVPEGLSNVIAITAGVAHTVALKRDGALVAWGINSFGATDVPAGLSGVTAIAAGGGFSVAILGAAVTLNAQRNGNHLVLSWPATAVGFRLQSTSSLTLPITWMDSPLPPVVISKCFTVTDTQLNSVQFFRLNGP